MDKAGVLDTRAGIVSVVTGAVVVVVVTVVGAAVVVVVVVVVVVATVFTARYSTTVYSFRLQASSCQKASTFDMQSSLGVVAVAAVADGCPVRQLE